MAISFVGGQTANRTNPSSSTSVTFSLTGGSDSTPKAGDLVIVTVVVGSAGGNPAMAIVTPSGYTALGQLNQSAATNDTSQNTSWKFMPATPDTAVTIPGTSDNAMGQSYTIQVFRGVDGKQPMDATPVSAGGTGTGRPDPGSITPVTAGAWPVICAGGAAGTGANYTAPANYTTNFQTTNSVETTDAMIGSGYRSDWSSGAENPAAYTGGTTNAADSWTAYTLALRPDLPDDTGVTNDLTTPENQEKWNKAKQLAAILAFVVPNLFTTTLAPAQIVPRAATITQIQRPSQQATAQFQQHNLLQNTLAPAPATLPFNQKIWPNPQHKPYQQHPFVHRVATAAPAPAGAPPFYQTNWPNPL